MSKNIVNARKPGLIHRKDWEWAMGILAMERFGKLNQQCSAIGIGAGREEILFHMANKFSKVYATDIYDGKGWKNFAPTDFLEDPKKYAPIPYREEALEVLKMDGTRLDFKDDSFDVAFSFSSIEHFGGDHHFGALKSLKEMERVLKTNGIAVISTEYIINNKEHHEFFNQRTIYTDLIDKLIELRPVEPLNLSLTKNTLNSVIDYDSAVMWDTTEEINDFKLNHPLILISLNDILLTSVMLVFQKK